MSNTREGAVGTTQNSLAERQDLTPCWQWSWGTQRQGGQGGEGGCLRKLKSRKHGESGTWTFLPASKKGSGSCLKGGEASGERTTKSGRERVFRVKNAYY